MSTPAAKRPRLGTPAADPPTTPSVLLFVPPVGVPHSGSVLKAWQANVPALGGSIIQDAQEAASLAAITHCVVPQPGGGWPSIPSSLHPGSTRVPPGLHYVTQQWVADCMRSQRWLPEDKYQPSSAELQQQQQPSLSKSGQDGHSSSTAAALAAWLGPSLWRPEHAEMDNTELLLQARCRQCLNQRRVDAMLLLAAQGDFDEERCRSVGNEQVVQALIEMKHYEVALNGQFLTDPSTGQQVLNHKSLAYAHAAAVVRTCAYRLVPPVEAGTLPYLAESTAAELNEILLSGTGTCQKLELFRQDQPVCHSNGELRPDSAGAATRRKFVKLLGVGAGTARKWWDLGMRSYEDVEAAAAGGGTGNQPLLKLTPVQRFGLLHRVDLLEGASSADVREMHDAVVAVLEDISGVTGWQVTNVGGSSRKRRADLAQQQRGVRGQQQQVQENQQDMQQEQQPEQEQPGGTRQGARQEAAQPQPLQSAGETNGHLLPAAPGSSDAPPHSGTQAAAAAGAGAGGGIGGGARPVHHDADFIVAHPTYVWGETLITRIRDELISRRHMLAPDTGAMCMLQRNRTQHLEAHVLEEMTGLGPHNNIQSDRLDHVFGVFRTCAGKLRHIDIILATPAQLPFALIGWIGSTQFCRFMRRLAKRRGMHLNNHGLYRLVDGGLARVPEDAPPLDRHKLPRWPPGWGPGSCQAEDGAGPERAAGPAGAAAPKPPECAAHALAGQCQVAAPAAAEQAAAAAAALEARCGNKTAPPQENSRGGSRTVRSQRDIFELLFLPYREPWQRDC
ncbi:DNA-directed DNA/RNA polymerase mu [Chlorella vulgaris]